MKWSMIACVLMVMSNPSEACDCARDTPGEHYGSAEQVVLVQAEPVTAEPTDSGNAILYRFRVLHALKGAAPESGVLTFRMETLSGCFPTLAEGGFGILAVHPGDDPEVQVSTCTGSGSLQSRGSFLDLEAYIMVSGGASIDDASVYALALEAAGFPAYLHGRERLLVHHAELVGQDFDFHGTELRFIEAIDGMPTHMLEPIIASQHGELSILELRYAAEGVHVRAVILGEKVLFAQLVER